MPTAKSALKKKSPDFIPEIAFIDLDAQQKHIKSEIDASIAQVLKHGNYIMGPEVKELEDNLAKFCGATYCLTCANGTDALALYLMAKNVGAGDAVFVPSFTFAATAEIVPWFGATPVFTDVLPDTFNINPDSLVKAIRRARELGLKPSGVISVDLFGLPADYDRLLDICQEHGLWLMDDAAQGFGGTYKGRSLGTFGQATTTSFFPAKPLGCYGDGGAIFTEDKELYDVLSSIRIHGKGEHKYDNVRIGMNSRLDTLQAAIMLPKLKIFKDELAARQRVAERYNSTLSALVETPYTPSGLTSSWAQYTIKVAPEKRSVLQGELRKKGIPTVVYYPLPLHQQTAYKDFPRAADSLEVSEQLSQCVLSLPMHPYLEKDTQDYIIESLTAALA